MYLKLRINIFPHCTSAPIPLESKHQIILTKKDHVTNLVAKYYHVISGHSGSIHGFVIAMLL